MQYVHLRQNHNNTRTKYSILELKSTLPRCKCLNRFKTSNYRILVLKIITMHRQYKQKLAAEYKNIQEFTQPHKSKCELLQC